ncbi:hypothetical protein JKP88DRAFT_9349 [Tribonema minus]|uniref:Uncharacterized protein n=1 Tax=Tribonema minus TaxID=303371 RepID=A0A835ZDB1_9STRA|nr:hypothetical protein JKP88DRAFT_9349 [Tribonema minus]
MRLESMERRRRQRAFDGGRARACVQYPPSGWPSGRAERCDGHGDGGGATYAKVHYHTPLSARCRTARLAAVAVAAAAAAAVRALIAVRLLCPAGALLLLCACMKLRRAHPRHHALLFAASINARLLIPLCCCRPEPVHTAGGLVRMRRGGGGGREGRGHGLLLSPLPSPHTLAW